MHPAVDYPGFLVSSCNKEDELFVDDHQSAIYNPFIDQITMEKKVFRAAWIATVGNLDWPTTKNNAGVQKQELITLLDNCKALNMNAVILQVRPNADAFYKPVQINDINT